MMSEAVVIAAQKREERSTKRAQSQGLLHIEAHFQQQQQRHEAECALLRPVDDRVCKGRIKRSKKDRNDWKPRASDGKSSSRVKLKKRPKS